MATKAIFALGLVVFALVVGAAELGYTINKSYVPFILACAAVALYFSMATTTGGEMAGREDGTGVIKVKAFGSEISAPAKTANIIILVFLCALAAFGWKHHNDSVEWSQKIYDATLKNTKAMVAMTYVMTLSQERRERLNLEMPEEVRQMQRQP